MLMSYYMNAYHMYYMAIKIIFIVIVIVIVGWLTLTFMVKFNLKENFINVHQSKFNHQNEYKEKVCRVPQRLITHFCLKG